MNKEMMKEIVELFGQNKVNELKNILKLRKGFENYSDGRLEEWICGYCISSFADLCEEFEIKM